MSAKLNTALDFANYRVTLNTQHNAIKAKVENLLSYSINGGTFTIDRALISFCKIYIDQDCTELVLLDIYNNPILVDLEDFYNEIVSRYFEATNDYHKEYEKLRKARKVHKVLDIHDDT